MVNIKLLPLYIPGLILLYFSPDTIGYIGHDFEGGGGGGGGGGVLVF